MRARAAVTDLYETDGLRPGRSTRVSLGILGLEISIRRICFENALLAEMPITVFAFSTSSGNWARLCKDFLNATNLKRLALEAS